jgi:hypothetical protein
MPWTFAHPAAAVLVRRCGLRSLPLSGLAIGSLSPDFGYYTGQFGLATAAHSLRGTLTICLPSAFLLVLLLQRLRPFLLSPLPDPHRTAIARLPPPSLWPLGHFARMVAALWAGAMTHVAWDSFTHASGAMVSIIAPLRQVLFDVPGRTFATYNLLQHAGTLFGIGVIGLAYCRWLARTTDIARCLHGRALRACMPLAMAVVSCGVLGFAAAVLQLGPGSGWPVLVFRGMVNSTIAFAVAYALLALRATLRSTGRS